MKAHRPYKLVDYDPNWKVLFSDISEKVRNVLGDIAIKIEHIGSTSVVGMVAKPQIDILVVVKKLEDVETKHQDMIDAGFTHHGRGYVNDDDDYFSLNTEGNVRVASIHILQENNPKIAQYVIFRDYLQSHKEERDLYIKTKKELYLLHSDNYANYDSGKSGAILEIRQRAIDWDKEKYL